MGQIERILFGDSIFLCSVITWKIGPRGGRKRLGTERIRVQAQDANAAIAWMQNRFPDEGEFSRTFAIISQLF